MKIMNENIFRLRGGSDVEGGTPLEIIKVSLSCEMCFDDKQNFLFDCFDFVCEKYIYAVRQDWGNMALYQELLKLRARTLKA